MSRKMMFLMVAVLMVLSVVMSACSPEVQNMISDPVKAAQVSAADNLAREQGYPDHMNLTPSGYCATGYEVRQVSNTAKLCVKIDVALGSK